MTDPYTPELRREIPITGDAFQARATHPCGRSPLRVSALCVGIAIALSGCRYHAQPPQPDEHLKEAGAGCYWLSKDYATSPDVQAALSDGKLTEAECDDVVMPHVEVSNNEWLIKVRREAVELASAGEAQRAETVKQGSVHEHATRKAGDAQ